MNDEVPVDGERFQAILEWLKENLSWMSEDAIMVTGTAMGYMEHAILLKQSQSVPHVGFVKNGEIGVMATEFLDKYEGRDKDAFAGAIRNFRKDCEIVVFASEVWMATMSKDEYAKRGEYPRVMPRDHPDRKEACMVQVWLHPTESSILPRHIVIHAFIHRDPLEITPWEVYHDSATAEHKMRGRFS